jgi:hypothetical protein
MSKDDQIQHHAQRATREMDQGLSAKSAAAARAHLELSSLHLQRARALGGRELTSPPPFILG